MFQSCPFSHLSHLIPSPYPDSVLSHSCRSFLSSVSSVPTVTFSPFLPLSPNTNNSWLQEINSFHLLTLPSFVPYPTQSSFPFLQNLKSIISVLLQTLASRGTACILSSFFLSGRSHSVFVSLFFPSRHTGSTRGSSFLFSIFTHCSGEFFKFRRFSYHSTLMTTRFISQTR